MKIDSNTPIRSIPSKGKGTNAAKGNSGFASHIGSHTSPQSPSVIQPMVGIESLMALQEVPDALARSKIVRVRARKLLDHLDEIKIGLVLGAFSKQNLLDLKNLVDSKVEDFEDPGLQEILKEIELRVHVELAKLEHPLKTGT
jgi:hypothetical protein